MYIIPVITMINTVKMINQLKLTVTIAIRQTRLKSTIYALSSGKINFVMK